MASHRLGWYVHYRTKNYKKYGLGYNEQTKESKVTPAELNAYKKEIIYQTQTPFPKEKGFRALFIRSFYEKRSQRSGIKYYFFHAFQRRMYG